MRAKIEVNKIHCERPTLEWSKDEIYFGIMVLSGKIAEENFELNSNHALVGEVSEVREKVSAGSAWKPEAGPFEFDVEDEGVFSVMLALYEKDSGQAYDEMKSSFEKLIIPGALNWSEILNAAISNVIKKEENETGVNVLNLAGLLSLSAVSLKTVIAKVLFDTGTVIWKHMKKDDCLGVYTFHVDLNDDSHLLPREFSFRKMRGKYQLSLQVLKTD